MYNHVLLAVDLDDENSWAKALPTAVECVKAFEATLHLVTVVPDFGTTTIVQFFPNDYENHVLEKAQRELHAFSEKHVPAGVSVLHHIRHGTIYEEILRTAKRNEIDLIVLAAHRPELRDYLLGPNAARVVRHAECSVLVVRK